MVLHETWNFHLDQFSTLSHPEKKKKKQNSKNIFFILLLWSHIFQYYLGLRRDLLNAKIDVHYKTKHPQTGVL